MSEEEKQALTGLCKIEIKRWKAASESNPNMRYMSKLMEIALAALTAQPVACKKRLVNHRSGVAHHWTYHGEVDRPSSGDIFRVEVVLLYEHAAPAADLSALVPPEMTWQDSNNMAEVAGFNECRSLTLRKIEEAK